MFLTLERLYLKRLFKNFRFFKIMITLTWWLEDEVINFYFLLLLLFLISSFSFFFFLYFKCFVLFYCSLVMLDTFIRIPFFPLLFRVLELTILDCFRMVMEIVYFELISWDLIYFGIIY